jgi:hypothetical protein
MRSDQPPSVRKLVAEMERKKGHSRLILEESMSPFPAWSSSAVGRIAQAAKSSGAIWDKSYRRTRGFS